MLNGTMTESAEMLTKIKACSEVICAALGAEISLLNVKSGTYYTLNRVAADIWRQIQDATTLAEIKHRLLEEYEVEESRMEHDLLRIVQELRANGLIEICPR